MKIIPAINCGNFECVKEKLKKSAEFSDWAQIDIADGKFTVHKTWNNPSELNFKLNLEIHLMVENPQDAIDNWLKAFRQNSGQAGAKRIIVHFETIKDSAAKNPENDLSDILNFILEKTGAENIEIGLAIAPKISVEEIIPYLNKINFIQVLTVDPGLAGQKFQPQILDKIKFLKSLGGKHQDIVVEVDGGINPETAKLCQEAGADIAVAASYIWDSENPKAAFEELSAI